MIGYQEFIEAIVSQIVAHPSDVKVEKIVDERGVLLVLSVNPEDIGYIIGKKGQTVTSLRTLLRIVGAKHNARVTLKVNEPEGRERLARTSDSAAPAPRTSDFTTSTPRPVAVESAPAKKSEFDNIDTSVIDNLEI